MFIKKIIRTIENTLFILLLSYFTLPYLNIDFFNGINYMLKPFFFLLSSLSFLYTILTNPLKKNSLSTFNIVFFAFFSYVIVYSLVIPSFDINTMAHLGAIFCCYCFFKNYFKSNSEYKVYKISLAVFFVILIVYCIHFFYLIISHPESKNNLFLPNNSIYAVLIASQLAFIIPLILFKHFKQPHKVNTIKILGISVFVLTGVGVLIYSNGRAGWIGFAAAIFFIVWVLLKNRFKWVKVIGTFALLTIIGCACLVFGYKKQSSSGRILIYKISFSIVKDNLLFGIGPGQTAIQFNKYQSSYFSKKDINTQEALLADNTYYTFNDYFQILVELGVMGVLFIIGLFILFSKIIFSFIAKEKNVSPPIIVAAIGSLIVILVAAFFTYPFEILPLQIQGILCIAIVSGYYENKNFHSTISKIPSFILKTVGLSISVLLTIYFLAFFSYKLKANKAFELSKIGYKGKALAIYRDIQQSYIIDGATMFQFAKELAYRNELQEAAMVLRKAKNYYTDVNVYKLSASIANEMGNYKTAENDYKIAVYMIPQKIVSRYDLLNFYLQHNNDTQALFWANSIDHMPIKVPTQTADYIKAFAASKLRELQK